MRILYATGSPASYMAPPRLSLEQINCGPDWLDADIGGYVTSRNTPLGDYDLAAIAAKLPADQQPEAVVCLVDASWRSTPRNLSAFRCPKILLVADTHHLNTPINGMIRYAQHEGFDRIVLLYDRHHAEFFQAAGLKQLFWFPGLTFPHDDRAIAAARSSTAVESRIAFVGQTGICHPRRIQMLSQLHAHNLPLSVKAMSQREGLGFYGSSLVGFNSSLNGDLNLRVFEILASGAMLLTDELAPASGLTDVWQKGRDLVTYASSAELVEKARHAIAHPEETKAIGAAGAKWFETHFSEQARRTAFQKLAFDGIAPEIFRLPQLSPAAAKPTNATLKARLIAGYEYVQELHRNLDRVVVGLDESVPEEFARHCATLPRVEIRRGPIAKFGRVDMVVIGRQNFNSPALAAAMNLWAWEDVPESERIANVRRWSSMGLTLANPKLFIFSRQRVNTHKSEGAIALVRLEQGAFEDALELAKRALENDPKSVDALLTLLELGLERESQNVAQTALQKLRVVAPHHPRLKELAAAPDAVIRAKKVNRFLRIARATLQQVKNPDGSDIGFPIANLGHAIALTPDSIECWWELGQALRQLGRAPDALSALLHVTSLDSECWEYQIALADVALTVGHGAVACEALSKAAELRPGDPLVQQLQPRARALFDQCNYSEPRDLLLSHLEVTRLHGTGVLIERFFPDARNFVTVRSRTYYKGVVNFGGVHFSMDLPSISEEARNAVLRRLLGPYKIRRILCIPYFATDFVHAITAREITGAPLCTYVMDDQVMHANAVSSDLAQRTFAASDLRLAISPEMVAEYSTWFRCSFGLLPPVVTTKDNEVPNDWTPMRGNARHCVLVGNIWSAKQFEQLRTISRTAKLKIDWFGNSKVSWLPQDSQAIEADGIFCQGFLPESQLAQRLANYPFVLLPSGALDGTEDNEWLTRLSLPSRMVFILTKTLTPMLVLGSPKTAAARFVKQFGLGLSSSYDAAEAQEAIVEITAPTRRAEILTNARHASLAFLMPEAGDWIWNSLAAKRVLPTPFDSFYRDAQFDGAAGEACGEGASASPVSEEPRAVETLDASAFESALQAILQKLSDHVLHDSYLPPNEPRQRADVRGAVLFLHHALIPFGSLQARLLATQRISQKAKSHRAVLVVWAELLEQAGDREEAAAKARQALALYYDDVYTQTLFVRCVGDVNFHADAKDRFCEVPFESFEIYKDGAVFPCNCTHVPFPIGNALTQTKEEIWQSPTAKAVRESILDGSFRFCSPMTCWKRFNLPKRSEHPEKFEQLKKIGVEGITPPKHLNLSYDLSCNLSCPSCRNGTNMASHEERKKLEHIRDRIVLPLLENKDAESAYITGSGDAFGSPHFRSVLKQLCDPKFNHVQITLGTNGQLITQRLWDEFQPLHARFRDITISIDGATPETFERLRRGSSWEKLLRTMGILEQARRAGVIPRIMVNMVVQQQNFLEMRRLVELCKGWAVDGIRFYRIRQWGNVLPGAFMESDVANPLHPRHHELLELFADPIFRDPIIDQYDMYALIKQVHAARPAESSNVVLALPAATKSSDGMDAASVERALQAISAKLSDHALHDSFLPPEEPRQHSDIRGFVRFLHHSLKPLGSVQLRLLCVQRLSRTAKNHRGLLVVWAELLEEAGERAEAAAKAREALSLYYNDVYTQTLFMRCAGEVNHHANGKDHFCPKPFRNFEIYEDGSVHICNTTCVPFPVGDASKQTAEEIWQSPAAKAIRASILDGSFRFCSPMTCPWRSELPKRSERPEEFEQLKQIGIDGTVQKPKDLSLSYDRSCNLSCPSCRNELLMAKKEQRDRNDRIRDRVVMPLLETAETAYITGSGDAFASPHFRGILKQLCDPRYKVEIHLGTNGQLITPRLWQEFEPLHHRFRDLMISIDGATPETFERLRRGSTWEKLQVSMGILRAARESRRIRRLRVNMVVQTDNFLEMRPLVALCKAWAVDTICFYRLRQWGNIVPTTYLASDIVNPLHPRHSELLGELAHPDFDDAIVDHYDMYELIAKAQVARKARSAQSQLMLAAPVVEELEPVSA